MQQSKLVVTPPPKITEHRRTSAMIAITLIAGVNIIGCRVGPRYQPLTVALQPFHNAPLLAPNIPAPPLETWWTGFNDEEMDRIIRRALSENLDLRGAVARVDQARAVARQTGSAEYPSVDLQETTTAIYQSPESELGRAPSHLPGYHRGQVYNNLGALASWEIDVFGSVRRGVEAANAEAEAAQASETGIRISVVAEAADAYLTVRALQMRLVNAKEQVSTDERLFELVQQRRDAGVASERELAQAEALVTQAKATIQPLNIQLEAQLNRLDVLMGSQPGTYAAELSALREIPVAPGLPAHLTPTELLRRRPDIIAAERRVAATNARIGQAIAEYYPHISLSGVLGSETPVPSHLFQSEGFQPASVLGLRWRLFDFGRVDGEVKQAQGANAEALAAYRKTALTASEDVENSIYALAETQTRELLVRKQIEALQRARDRSQEAYVAGVLNLTDVLNADRELLVATDDLEITRLNAVLATVGIYRAIGGGWTP